MHSKASKKHPITSAEQCSLQRLKTSEKRFLRMLKGKQTEIFGGVFTSSPVTISRIPEIWDFDPLNHRPMHERLTRRSDGVKLGTCFAFCFLQTN